MSMADRHLVEGLVVCPVCGRPCRAWDGPNVWCAGTETQRMYEHTDSPPPGMAGPGACFRTVRWVWHGEPPSVPTLEGY